MLKLTAQSPLNGYAGDSGDISIREISHKSLISLAVPLNGATTFASTVKDTYGLTIPKTGAAKTSKSSDVCLMGMQPDQYFLMFENSDIEPLKAIPKGLADVAYVTDQSDSFVFLQVSGPRSREALERICPIDIHADAFKLNAVARTSMEHLGTVIMRDGKDSFLLLSASSSAESLLHAVETSIKNVL